MARFVYFYFNRDAPERIGPVVEAHVKHWHSAKLPSYMGGPFADHTGGLISFEAPSLQEAAALVEQDPFVREDLIEQGWLKEWAA